MNRGADVVRVSLRSDGDGKIGDHGNIERVFEQDGHPFGYIVVWKGREGSGQYVAPCRIVDRDAYEADERRRPRE